MKTNRVLPLIALGLSLAYAQQDPLSTALDTDLTTEWHTSFSLCARVLKYKGEGKDDYALKQLLSGAPSDAAKDRYKIAQSRPKDAFWNRLVAAGAPLPSATACHHDLSNILEVHLAAQPKDLGDAANDADTSSFLALYDLLREIPPGGFPAAGGAPAADQPTVANTYRSCFSDATNLFTMVKRKLGQIP